MNAMPLRKSWRWIGAFGPDVMLCVAHARVGVLRRSWWAVWDGTQLHEGTRAPFELTLERRRADRGHHRPGLDAQDAAARTRDRARAVRSTCPACSTSPTAATPGGPSWLWSAGAGRDRGRRPGDLEPRRRHAPGREHRVGGRRRRTVWTRHRSTGSPASATCASPRSPPARSRRTTSSSPPTTSSRSARSPAACRRGENSRAGLRRDGAPRGEVVTSRNLKVPGPFRFAAGRA